MGSSSSRINQQEDVYSRRIHRPRPAQPYTKSKYNASGNGFRYPYDPPEPPRKLLTWHRNDETRSTVRTSQSRNGNGQRHREQRDDPYVDQNSSYARTTLSKAVEPYRIVSSHSMHKPLYGGQQYLDDAQTAVELSSQYARENAALEQENARLAMMVWRSALDTSKSEILAASLARQDELAAGNSRRAKALNKRLTSAQIRAQREEEQLAQMKIAEQQRRSKKTVNSWLQQQRGHDDQYADPAVSRIEHVDASSQPDYRVDLAVSAARFASQKGVVGAKLVRAQSQDKHRHAETTHKQRAPHKHRTFECAACLEQHSAKHMVQLACSHWYCHTAIDAAIENACTSRNLFKCCNTAVRSATDLVSCELATTYNLLVEELTTPNPIYCSRRKCSAFIPAVPRKISKSPDIVVCPSCKHETCRHCRGRAHPRKICASDAGIQQVLKLGTKQGWKQCPRCKHMVEKTFGCVHMTCKCGKGFCYRCGGNFSKCRGATCGNGIV